MSGILYGIGVGPGDPELMTIKAVRRIRECTVIAIPHRSKELHGIPDRVSGSAGDGAKGVPLSSHAHDKG